MTFAVTFGASAIETPEMKTWVYDKKAAQRIIHLAHLESVEKLIKKKIMTVLKEHNDVPAKIGEC